MSGNRRSGPRAGPGGRGGPPPRASVELGEIDRLYVDGNNLLHRRGGTPAGGRPTIVAERLLLASLRAAIPEKLDVVLMLDGQPDPGAPSRERVRHGLEVRHAGRVDADSVLVKLVSERPFADRWRTLVVSDDRGLVERVRHAGGRTARLDWLDDLLRAAESGGAAGASRASGGPRASVGQGRRPPTVRTEPVGSGAAGGIGSDKDANADRDTRQPWQPGRGATRKRGNPRRGHPPG